jgi:tetratricopeptide (TPR) repeat protein
MEVFKFPDLNRIEKLIYKEKLDEAMREVEHLENQSDLDQEGRLQNQIFKSLIYTRMGHFQNGLKIAEHAIEEAQKIKNPQLVHKALISKAMSLYELGKLDICLNVIKEGLALFKAMDIDKQLEIKDGKATLKYIQGKVFWKKSKLDEAHECLNNSLSIKQEIGSLSGVADILNSIGIINLDKGELDLALNFFERSLTIFKKHGIKPSIAKSKNNIGRIYWKKGELDLALENFKASLVIYEELKNRLNVARVLLNMGLIYWNKGELDDALDFYNKSLGIYEGLENKNEKALCLNNIAIIYQFKGELDQALQIYQENLTIHEELGNKQQIAVCENNIGDIHHSKGHFDKAVDSYKKSLTLFEEVGNNIDMSEPLFNLVSVAIDQGSIEQTQLYLRKLQEIDMHEDNNYINQKYRLAQAIVLKESDRVIDIAEAQKILQELSQEEMISLEHKVTADINLCELLLQEIKTTGNEDILNELDKVLSQLSRVAEDQNSYIWLAKTNWLRSKVALLEFDLKQSQRLLSRAELIAHEKGLKNLSIKIASERNILLNQFNKWEKLLEQKPSVTEIIELTQIGEMVERMIQKKLDTADEDVMEYALVSRRLVELWEKD